MNNNSKKTSCQHVLRQNRRLVLTAGILLFVLAVARNHPAVVAQSDASDPARSEQDVDLFLPSINNASGPPISATPSPTPTKKLPFSLTPGPITDAQPNPDIDMANHPEGGACGEGTHLAHIESGFLSVQNPDTVAYDDNDYACEPDQNLGAVACGDNGAATLINGIAACACEEGYAGASCELCGAGYETDGSSQSCQPVKTKLEPVVEGGIEASMAPGSSKTFSAKKEDGGRLDGTWTLEGAPAAVRVGGAGVQADTACLFVPGGDETCQTSVAGWQVGFNAPQNLAEGEPVVQVQMKFVPADPAYAAAPYSVVIVNGDWFPINGFGDARMTPLLEALTIFMKQRCAGAAILGVSRYGTPLATYGIGRMIGRGAADWLENCGDNLDAPLAAPLESTTPTRIGSVSKTVTAAVMRWIVGEKLEDNDTDVAVTRVSTSRFVAAHRTESGQVQLVVYDADRNENLTEVGNTVYTLPTVEGITNQLRDLSLITLENGAIVLGMRDAADRLRLAAWTIELAGTLQFASDLTLTIVPPPDSAELPQLVDLEMAALADNAGSTNRFVVATRTDYGRVDLFVVGMTRNQLTSLGTGIFPFERARGVDVVDISDTTSNFSRVVLGKQDGPGNQVMTVYDIAADGSVTEKDNASFAGDIQGLSLTARTRRIVSAVRMISNVAVKGSLRLVSWNIDPDGQIAPVKNIVGDPVHKLAVVGMHVDRVVVAAQRTSDNHLRLLSYAVASDGGFTLTDTNDGAGLISALDAAPLEQQLRVVVVMRNSTNNLQSINWTLDSAGVITRKGDADGDKVPDATWTQEYVEEMRLVGYDLPDLLLPRTLQAILAREEPPPVYISDGKGDEDEIADEVEEEEETKTEKCDDLVGLADPQWMSVTLLHVLEHRSGLQTSAPGYGDILPKLFELRGLTHQAQEGLLRAEFGDQKVDDAKASLGYANSTTLYVVPPPDIIDVLLAVSGRCLRYELGVYKYSNTGPSFIQAVIEHVLDGLFAAEDGYPNTHENSALDRFFEVVLGVETTSASGIFNHQGAHFGLFGGGIYEDPIPVPRVRLTGADTYYPEVWDRKLPHCVQNGGPCSFSDWIDCADKKPAYNDEAELYSCHTKGTIRWTTWDRNPVPFHQFDRATTRGGEGGLATAPGPFLTFMRKFWVDNSPLVGTMRNSWNVGAAHDGALGGGRAQAVHFGTDVSRSFSLPRQREADYLPNVLGDTFKATEPAYLVADAQSGQIVMYNTAGEQANLLDIGEFAADDTFDVGENGNHGVPNSFYIARAGTGLVEVYRLPSGDMFSYSIGYDAGDGFAVGDIDKNDIYDEVVICDASSGELRIYPSTPGLPDKLVPGSLDQLVVPLKTYNLGCASGDKVAIGNANGSGDNEIFLARAASGIIEIIDDDGAAWFTLDAGMSVEDDFAVGDVLGANQDEILVGRSGNGKIDIYNCPSTCNGSSNQYKLLTSFPAAYGPEADLAVNDLGRGTEEIIIGVPGFGSFGLFILKTEKITEDGVDSFLVNLELSPSGGFAAGSQVAGGYWAGQHHFECSLPDGTRRSLPPGVDIIFAVNQNNDKICEEAESCSSYYGTMYNVMKYGVCQIDWTDIVANPPQ